MDKTYSLSRRLVQRLAHFFITLLLVIVIVVLLNGDSPVNVSKISGSLYEVLASLKLSGFIGLLAYVVTLSISFILLILSLISSTLRSTITSISDLIGSVPLFVIGSLAMYFVCFRFGWAPLMVEREVLSSYLLPILLLSLKPALFIFNQTQTHLEGFTSGDIYKCAMAKGLPPLQIFRTHLLKLTAPLLLGQQPLVIANLLTGSVIIESLFGIGGLGVYFVSAIEERDTLQIVMSVAVFSILLHWSQWLSEFLAAELDPRLKRHQ